MRGQEERRTKIREWLFSFKRTKKCIKCGEDDFRVLDFHHLEEDKEMNIGDAIRLGYSIKKIEIEIQKCEILCCKCHRILHWEIRALG